MMKKEEMDFGKAEFGKYEFIEYLLKKFEKSGSRITGDDAAVIDNGENLLLSTTDLLLEGIHFNLTYTPLKHLGYKAVIRAISDIMAMNGTPGELLMAIGASSKVSFKMIEEIYEGIELACSKYDVALAGGDLSGSLTGLVICVSATGSVQREHLTRRNGAKPNDLICVTGDLGAAYAGLQVLERERRLFEKEKGFQPELSGYDYVIGRQLKPELPATVLADTVKAGIIPTSMIDVTEGLASDLLQICKSSGTGCRIFSKNIPVDHETAKVAEEFGIDPLVAALNGGEDFEMLFTVSLEKYDELKKIKGVSVIGHITETGSGHYLVGNEGTEIELVARGWKG